LGGSGANKKIAVMGLTFKPKTDDMRSAPSLAILPALIDKGAHIHAHDPTGVTEATSLLPASVQYYEDVYSIFHEADAVVLTTEWNQYRRLDPGKVKTLMRGTPFVDLRNVYERVQMKSLGLNYSGVGVLA
jgi:UDPglucose 6-dehydrogenase